jgi:hypothetical protein
MHKYKIVDVKAPRFRKTKYETRLVVTQLHKEFTEQTGIQIDMRTFRKMYNENMSVIREFVVAERNGIVLPEQMGNIHLAFFKRKRPMYNFVEGMRTGMGPVEHFWESDNLQGKICWDYKDLKYKPKHYYLYGFTGCRELKKMATNAFTNTPQIFKTCIYTNVERRKIKQLEYYERYYKGSIEPAKGSEQSSELGQSVD